LFNVTDIVSTIQTVMYIYDSVTYCAITVKLITNKFVRVPKLRLLHGTKLSNLVCQT